MSLYKKNINYSNTNTNYKKYDDQSQEEPTSEQIYNQLPNIKRQAKIKNTNSSAYASNSKIIINVSDTQYDIVLDVCQNILKWKLSIEKDYKLWDVCWTDHAVSIDILMRMEQHQKINHFPGMSVLSRKNLLAKNLYRMQQKFPEQYDYFPKTWLLPYDYNKLKIYWQQLKKIGHSKTFIVKPEASSQGRGIFLTKNIYEIESSQHCVVQKYITNPLLYKGLKFDLRVYVLIAGCDPLRIYIYNEGLVRLATQNYQKPSSDNMDNLYMHLTNYAINKDHPNFIYNQSQDNLNYGHKRSLAQFFQTLKRNGVNSVQIWADIKDIIIKTLISGQPHLAHQYRVCQPNNLENNMCFQILGFDFMINTQNKVYLLQINYTPSFHCESPLDQLVKSNLIRDTLVLMNINRKNRQKALNKAKQAQDKRVFTGKTIKLDKLERIKLIAKYQYQRDLYEDQNLGSYQKIYPSFDQDLQRQYQIFLKHSQLTYHNNSHGTNIRQKGISHNTSKIINKILTQKRQSTKITLQAGQRRSNIKLISQNKRQSQYIIKFNSRSNLKNPVYNENIKVMLLSQAKQQLGNKNKDSQFPRVDEKTIQQNPEQQKLIKSELYQGKQIRIQNNMINRSYLGVYNEKLNTINNFLSIPYDKNREQDEYKNNIRKYKKKND